MKKMIYTALLLLAWSFNAQAVVNIKRPRQSN